MLLVLCFSARLHAAITVGPGDYTIAVLPDTQYETYTSDPDFGEITEWLADNATNLNIAFVFHLGDITFFSSTSEYGVADSAMDALDGAVPYGIVPGNHDLGWFDWGTNTTFDATFPVSRFESLPSFGGNYPAPSARNSYHLLAIGGRNHLLLCLEDRPSSNVLSWANTVLSNHPSHLAIVGTHSYLAYDRERRWAGPDLWDLVRAHDNVSMVLCAHIQADRRRISINDNGRPVYELAHRNANYLRFYVFRPAAGRIDAYTYDPVSDTYDTDGQSEFALPYVPDPPASGNQAPSVDAGAAHSGTLDPDTGTVTLALAGTASDADGEPDPPSALALCWRPATQVGPLAFGDMFSSAPTVSFHAPGVYELELTATDGDKAVCDTTLCRVLSLNAGLDRTVTLPDNVVSLHGTVQTNGWPAPGALTNAWTLVDGPGGVTFADPAAADTAAVFGEAGLYTLRLSAGDGVLDAQDDVVISVEAACAFTAYNDLMWSSGEPSENITKISGWNTNGLSSSGQLLAHESGQPLGITLSVTAGTYYEAFHAQGADAADATDADRVFRFGTVIGAEGVVSGGGSTYSFSGLASTTCYELVFFGNRDVAGYTARQGAFTISGAAHFTNTSSAGTTILSQHAAQDTTEYCTGYNTENGYVARFSDIDPGPDGVVTVALASTTSGNYVNTLCLSARASAGAIEPHAPSQLAAMPIAADAIVLSWQDNSVGETGFVIRCSLDGVDFDSLPALSVGANATSTMHTACAPDTRYYYLLRATGPDGDSMSAGPVHATTPPASSPTRAYLLLGQSNMSGRGPISADPDQVPHARVLQLTVSNQWQQAVDPLHHHDYPTGPLVGPGLTFGKTVANSNGTSVVGLIPCAHGGTAISEWAKGSALYSNAIARAAVATNSGAVLMGILWHQGEADSRAGTATANAYQARLTNLIADLRADLRNPQLPFVCGQIGPWLPSPPYTWADTVNAALSNLPSIVSNTACVPAGDLTHIGDEVHFDAPSARELGRRYAAALATLEPPPSPAAKPENLLAAAVSPTEVVLSWTDMSDNENGFRLRSSTDGVDFYTRAPIELPADTTTWTDSALAPGTVYYYKIKATDAFGGSAYDGPVKVITHPAPTEMVGRGALWQYRKGTAEPSAPPIAWRYTDCDTGDWESGPAPFGYGDGPYGTELLDMQSNYPCLFLRHDFLLDCPTRVRELALWVLYDDGFIAWLNGQELARINVNGAPGSFNPHSDTANASVGNGSEWSNTWAAAALPPLAAGTNVLAIQVFNRSLSNSSDLTLDAELQLLPSQLPITQDDDQDGMHDDWEFACFGHTNRSALDDLDQDGLVEIDEYVAGTDPTTNTGILAVQIDMQPGDTVLVSLPTVQALPPQYQGYERRYALEHSAGVRAYWQALPGYGSILGNGQTIIFTNTLDPDMPLFFRGRVWLQAQ